MSNTATGEPTTESKREGTAPLNQSDPGEAPPLRRPRRGGPKTDAGKRIVSQNATTHGITSPSPVAGGEDPAEWEKYKREWHEYFKPHGVPELELVDILAITSWRRRRIVRREVALIGLEGARVEAALSSSVPLERYEEKLFRELGRSVADAIELLEKLDELDSDYRLELGAAFGAFVLLYASGSSNLRELPDAESLEFLGTAGALREWIADHDVAGKTTSRSLLQWPLDHGRDLHAHQARRQKAMEEARAQRDRAVQMPSVHDMDNLVRHEAHLDRTFARALSQLELLQRQRIGENVPPPERVEVTIH